MQPQFLSRFDNAVILEDLNPALLSRIFAEPENGVRTSQGFFRRYNIDLQVTDQAVQRIAEEAAKSSRIGARALKSIYGRIIKPFEFDPFSHSGAAAGRRRRGLPAGHRRRTGRQHPQAADLTAGGCGAGRAHHVAAAVARHAVALEKECTARVRSGASGRHQVRSPS